MKTKLKDNKIFRWIIIPLCVTLCFVGRFIPPSFGLTSDAWGVIFIFLGTIILWLTIGIDRPSLICLLGLGFLENFGFGKVFTSSFGNSTFVFLLFTFACTYALSKSSLIKRIAIYFVNSKLAKRSGNWFVSLFLLATLILGLFISPSVLFVVMLPILNEILDIAKVDKNDKIAKTLMMGLGFTVSISSGMTPIAHVFPILAMNAAGIEVSPILYMGFAIPVGIIIFILMLLMFRFILRPDYTRLKNIDVSSLKKTLPKVDKRDIITVSVFAVVILLWILPSIFRGVSEDFYQAINKFGTAMPPLLGTVVLCILRVDDKPLIKIDDALKNGIPWSSLIMCAGTLALGAALTSDAIGLKNFLETNLSASLANLPELLLLIVFVLWAAIQTNLSSNMVTATLVATVASSILVGVGSELNLSVVICLIGMMASFAFATPPSMPHIAIVAGSDSCTTKDVLIYGGMLMIISIVVTLLIGYPLGTLIL